MRRPLLLLSVLLVAGVVVWWLRAGTGPSPVTAYPSPVDQSASAPKPTKAPSLEDAPSALARDGDERAVQTESVMTLSLADFLASEHPELEALSPEEADWLRKHGYPTARDLQMMQSMTAEQLWQRGKRGDLVAASLLGHKYLSDGDVDMAAAAFSNAAQHGSLYAREQAAIVDLTRGPGAGLAHEYTGFAVEMEIARIFGDHRVDAIIRRVVPQGAISSAVQQNVLASLPAQMQLMAEDARLRGVPMSVPDPRPNMDIWSQIDAGTATQVTVYPRSDVLPPGGP